MSSKKRKTAPRPPVGDVMAAWVHSEWVAHSWAMSLTSVVATSARIGPHVAMKCATGGLVAARNRVAEAFLASDAQWLWITDTDAGFPSDTLDRLLAAADPVHRPVVGALAFASTEVERDGANGFRVVPVPALYHWAELPDGRRGFVPFHDYPRDTLVQVAGTGSHCILLHRSALQRVADEHGPTWYDRIPNEATGPIGEDLSLCLRLGAVGVPVHVHTGIRSTHLKHVFLSELDYDGGARDGKG